MHGISTCMLNNPDQSIHPHTRIHQFHWICKLPTVNFLVMRNARLSFSSRWLAVPFIHAWLTVGSDDCIPEPVQRNMQCRSLCKTVTTVFFCVGLASSAPETSCQYASCPATCWIESLNEAKSSAWTS